MKEKATSTRTCRTQERPTSRPRYQAICQVRTAPIVNTRRLSDEEIPSSRSLVFPRRKPKNEKSIRRFPPGAERK